MSFSTNHNSAYLYFLVPFTSFRESYTFGLSLVQIFLEKRSIIRKEIKNKYLYRIVHRDPNWLAALPVLTVALLVDDVDDADAKDAEDAPRGRIIIVALFKV